MIGADASKAEKEPDPEPVKAEVKKPTGPRLLARLARNGQAVKMQPMIEQGGRITLPPITDTANDKLVRMMIPRGL